MNIEAQQMHAEATVMAMEKHIRGRDATNVAIENDKRRPIALGAAPNDSVGSAPVSIVPAQLEPDSDLFHCGRVGNHFHAV
jgi:hypothetical protein